jgi:hypothetical protein
VPVSVQIGPRAAPWIAWAAFAITVVAGAVSVVLAALGSGVKVPSSFEGSTEVGPTVVNAILFALLAGTGALIASRSRGNLIGWILCLTPIALAGTTVIEAFYVYGRYVDPDALPEGRGLIWLANWAWIVGYVPLVTLVLLLFPDGRLASPGWRSVAWLALGTAMILILGYAFAPGPIVDYPVVANPLGIPGALGSIFREMQDVGLPLLAIAAAASAAALVIRFRGASGEQRQQLRWVAVAGAAAIFFWLAGVLLQTLLSTGGMIVSLGLMLLPIAIAIAILRYRLYDLDVVVNRTVVYGALTATLGAFYLGSVLLLQLVLHGLTGAPNLAIAASTLAAAAMFQPLRRRIQVAVDRRFYRRKYDAQRTLAAFGARLRREVDIDALRAELTGVVDETMRPAHVSLYLRAPGAKPAPVARRPGAEIGIGAR